MMIFSDELLSPIGIIRIQADKENIISILFASSATTLSPNGITDECKKQLKEYFRGQRKTFNLPLKMAGTPFQKQAWKSLMKIPFGETATYGEQAKLINSPKAARAVGAANGKNKISIVIPCHRIIGANGTLTGYAGGLERKKWLLQHEAENLNED